MARAEPSWRAVAGQLAARLRHHALCEAHPESKPDPDCPFCKDRAAYRVWQRKAGVQDPPPYTGPTVDVIEWKRHKATSYYDSRSGSHGWRCSCGDSSRPLFPLDVANDLADSHARSAATR